MKEQYDSRIHPLTTQVFDALTQMQEEVKRQNTEMGWYAGTEVEYRPTTLRIADILQKAGEEKLVEAIYKLNDDLMKLQKERLFSNCCMNLVGEVAEMFESYRSGTLHKPCDKAAKMEANGIPVLTAEEEEVADVVIRALDYGGRFNVDVAKAVLAKHQYNRTRGYRHGNKQA
jgi:hypothetical protein